ncbi:hypothetical protein [Nocardia stercoris]|uniref:Ig-like domain repeat protein n=1 Tax=Nocardia stercoris TaxID=2483361 RepID=A0A3M2L1M1_9NOCA|nr:hypothetical protein [Nocardia stercoris]RMI30403.1 hypothetical protein EBN03_22470 [Nocardia stercoris]
MMMRTRSRRIRSATIACAALAATVCGLVTAVPAAAATYQYTVAGNTDPAGAYHVTGQPTMFSLLGGPAPLTCATATFSGSMPNVAGSSGTIGTLSAVTFAQCTDAAGAPVTVTATVHPATLTVTGGATISGSMPSATIGIAVSSATCSYSLAPTTVPNWTISSHTMQLAADFRPQAVTGACGSLPPVFVGPRGAIEPTVTSSLAG